SEQPLTLTGQAEETDPTDGRPRDAAPRAEELVTLAPSERRIEAVPKAVETPAEQLEMQAALLDRTQPETLAAEIDELARMPENDDSSRVAAPTTQESIL